jgi:hypothetical protein
MRKRLATAYHLDDCVDDGASPAKPLSSPQATTRHST